MAKRTAKLTEAATAERKTPDALHDPGQTAKWTRAELEALIAANRLASGTRAAVTEDDARRFETREKRETVPAPPEAEEEAPVTVPRPVTQALLDEGRED